MPKLSGISHVGCNDHKLNLEVNRIVSAHSELEDTIARVHETMRLAKTSIKNVELLRNLMDMKPIMHNPTRWSGKYWMLKRFSEIRSSFIDTSKDDESSVPINTSESFRGKVFKFQSMLNGINFVTHCLRTRRYTLSESRRDLDVLVEAVQE